MAVCGVCFRHCELSEGQIGFCGARICAGGTVRAANYGRITSLALDPIEKKPLRRFRPGSLILSAGSYGCNLRCPFCQNYEISWSQEAMRYADRAELVTPEQIAETAQYYKRKGNVGVAFTYNEPLVGYEFVRDTAKIVHERGMVNVLVSNGTAEVAAVAAHGKNTAAGPKPSQRLFFYGIERQGGQPPVVTRPHNSSRADSRAAKARLSFLQITVPEAHLTYSHGTPCSQWCLTTSNLCSCTSLSHSAIPALLLAMAICCSTVSTPPKSGSRSPLFLPLVTMTP